MKAKAGDENAVQSWESVHVCPSCGHIVNLAELDLRAITMVSLTNCQAELRNWWHQRN
jgi:hypothetical protein